MSTLVKGLLPLSGIESPYLSYATRSLVTIPTELSLILIFVAGCEVIRFHRVVSEETDLLVCCVV